MHLLVGGEGCCGEGRRGHAGLVPSAGGALSFSSSHREEVACRCSALTRRKSEVSDRSLCIVLEGMCSMDRRAQECAHHYSP